MKPTNLHEELRFEIAAHLEELSGLFKSHCKLTLIMRNPLAPNGDLFVSDDDPSKVIESIRKTCRLK